MRYARTARKHEVETFSNAMKLSGIPAPRARRAKQGRAGNPCSLALASRGGLAAFLLHFMALTLASRGGLAAFSLHFMAFETFSLAAIGPAGVATGNPRIDDSRWQRKQCPALSTQGPSDGG